MKSISERTQLKLNGINLVNSYRAVLSINEFVDAMNNATNLYLRPSSSDEDTVKEPTTLEEQIFGKDHEDISARFEVHTHVQHILTDDTVPVFWRKIVADKVSSLEMTIKESVAALTHARAESKR